jgi:HD-like signal output (HDOD) protein
MSKPRVLFVDDEPRILDGLRRSLRGKRGDWEMSFVTSGSEALQALRDAPHDVVVSDMRMPGMDGAELLTHVSRQHPEVARVVLSGHTEPEAAIKVAVAGHRFLTKPSDADGVVAVIEQLLVTTSGTHPAEVRRIAGGVRALPTLPVHAERFQALLQAPEIDLSSAIHAASHDVGLTAKLLQLSNSAFFGARSRTASVDGVVNALGVPTLQALVGAGRLLWSSAEWGPEAERRLSIVWRHAAATAWVVESIASPANRANAQAAALLQDVGRFVCLAGEQDGVCSPARDSAATHSDGIPYRDVGVELLHLWGLPSPVVAAVAERDVAHRPVPSGLGVSGAVRAAHLLVQETDSRDPSVGSRPDELTLLLAHPQIAGRSPDWAAAAAEASERAGRLIQP